MMACMPVEDPRSDLELVRAANRGEEAAFELLYLRYRDWVVGLAFRLTGSREEALDIAQEVFLWLLQLFPGFELRANMKTVLYPVVRNAALTRGRRKGIAQVHAQSMTTLAVSRSTDASAPDDHETLERRAALAEGLSSLPEIHREILMLRFADDLSLEEIALAIGLPLGTVKSRLHHALESLRRHPMMKIYFSE